MVAIRLTAYINEDRQIIADLPENIPSGPVELQILVPEKNNAPVSNPEHEAVKAKLKAAGVLIEYTIPPDIITPTKEELRRARTPPLGAPSTLESINKDRGEL